MNQTRQPQADNYAVLPCTRVRRWQPIVLGLGCSLLCWSCASEAQPLNTPQEQITPVTEDTLRDRPPTASPTPSPTVTPTPPSPTPSPSP
ncbi:MAG: hypothetical protein SAJ12_18140, partial [Jaaginema sp. PMC 1079.18]|nr:hypothetical protein [Jaaginema sp. PMC 1079.18]